MAYEYAEKALRSYKLRRGNGAAKGHVGKPEAIAKGSYTAQSSAMVFDGVRRHRKGPRSDRSIPKDDLAADRRAERDINFEDHCQHSGVKS
ncbi:unnamed protein product [Heligmosomoides polygyrus]|uniref:SCP domain-containing protein n=1 Tax=Heligmosomoides polygyrus TaxID=6339 RepID=A0A183GSB8_HELPZ|nr:unnamed protein product [Heligmosomoides polygyrus]